MAGLLSMLGNLDEDQQQGLLAAAAQMLQASGPSRTPTSFGQIIGGGLGAFQAGTQAARARKQEEEQAAQIAQLRGLQIQDAQSDLKKQDIARNEAERLRQFYMGGQTASAAANPQGQM